VTHFTWLVSSFSAFWSRHEKICSGSIVASTPWALFAR
jgi:hypothetical protein